MTWWNHKAKEMQLWAWQKDSDSCYPHYTKKYHALNFIHEYEDLLLVVCVISHFAVRIV